MTENNNKKISIWKKLKQEFKKDISIVWRTKKKWIVAVYLLIVALFTIIQSIIGWKEVNLLEHFAAQILLFPLIFGLFFFIPQEFKKFEQQGKELAEIEKKAKINNPKKYRKVSLMWKMTAPFLLLGCIASLLTPLTIPSDNHISRILITSITFAFFFMAMFFYCAIVLYCKEISQPKEESKTGAES